MDRNIFELDWNLLRKDNGQKYFWIGLKIIWWKPLEFEFVIKCNDIFYELIPFLDYLRVNFSAQYNILKCYFSTNS